MGFKKVILYSVTVLVAFLYLGNLISQTTAPGPRGSTAPRVKPKGTPLPVVQKKIAKGEAKEIYCLGEKPSLSGQNHVLGFLKTMSRQEKEDFYCSLYQSFGQRYLLKVPSDIVSKYQSKLKRKIPESYEVLSSVEQCFGNQAKPFCSRHRQQNIERKALEFSWKHGTKRSPFANNLDYLRGIGFLMDALHKEVTAGGNR